MTDYFLLLLVFLTLIAALLRADFVLTLIYLLAGVFFIGRWWSQHAMEALTARRTFEARVFLGERVPVKLSLANTSLLPVVWLQFHESLPPELTISSHFRQVISVGSKSVLELHYNLEGRKRGYYTLGPLQLNSGDIFGLGKNTQRNLKADHLVVYPKIVPLSRVRLPSRSPMGTLRHIQPIFEDPSRVQGKREYIAGDSLRRVDWKATASTGKMQVKLFEPSIALETMIFLNLNSKEYDYHARFQATELAIVVAASLANWVISQRQAVGLVSNGLDPILSPDCTPYAGCAQPVPARPGRAHLMRILDVLARIQMGETFPLVDAMERELVNLPWGTTMFLITSKIDEALFDRLFQARRSGLSAVLVPCGTLNDGERIRQQAAYFGFPFFQIYEERDLDMWRK